MYLFVLSLLCITFEVAMNHSIPVKKTLPSAKASLFSASVSKPNPKNMSANYDFTATGALKVQKTLEGTLVSGSKTMFHSALLLFKKVYFTCLPCYLGGIEKKYLHIFYTQIHDLKCVNFPTFIDLLGKHTEFHHLIPQCTEIDEFEHADETP